MDSEIGIGLLTSTPKKDFDQRAFQDEPTCSIIGEDENNLNLNVKENNMNIDNKYKYKDCSNVKDFCDVATHPKPVSIVLGRKCDYDTKQETTVVSSGSDVPLIAKQETAVISSGADVPISAILKNKVRERLYALINDLDGYNPSREQSLKFTQSLEKSTCKLSSNILNKSTPTISDFLNKSSKNSPRDNKSRSQFRDNLSSKSISPEKVKLNMLQKVLHEKVSHENSQQQEIKKKHLKKKLFIKDDCIDKTIQNIEIQENSSKMSNSELYKRLFESASIITDLKQTICHLQMENNSMKATFLNNDKSLVSRPIHVSDGNIPFYQYVLPLQTSNTEDVMKLKAKNDVLIQENLLLKDKMMTLTVANKENKQRRQQEMKKYEESLMEINEKLSGKENELKALSKELSESELRLNEAKINYELKIRKMMEKYQYIPPSPKEPLMSSPEELKKYYEDLLKEQHACSTAQIAEYKKALKILKEDLKELKPK